MKLCLRLCFFLLTWWTLASAATVENIPVNYGGDENTDACSTLAQVANLSAAENEFLAVKSAPSLKAKRMDKIFKGQSLWICDENKDWYGIVYSRDEKQDCGVTSPVVKRKSYSGPCKSGWVHKKYVKPLAG
jgi:hypothetical protein